VIMSNEADLGKLVGTQLLIVCFSLQVYALLILKLFRQHPVDCLPLFSSVPPRPTRLAAAVAAFLIVSILLWCCLCFSL
jgi:hypothetical protein